jgi:DNA-binding MarR family transcriptional regulator
MNTDASNGRFRELALLEKITADPDISQAKLAEELGVAIGTVNWHLKRLVEKGFVKVKRIRRRKLRYIITPEGIGLRAQLTLAYVQQSFSLFRQIQRDVRDHLQSLKELGIAAVRLEGSGDIAEVCRLICLEGQMTLTDAPHAPALVVDGLSVRLEFDDAMTKNKKRSHGKRIYLG